jgi:hypothetical protein
MVTENLQIHFFFEFFFEFFVFGCWPNFTSLKKRHGQAKKQSQKKTNKLGLFITYI